MVEQHQKLIYSIVGKIVGRKMGQADIEDIVQVINMRLLEEHGSKSLTSFDPAAGMELTTFIGMIAKCEAVDALRRVRNQVPVEEQGDSDDHAYYTPVSAEADALASLIRREQASRVREAIKMLSEDDQRYLEVLMSDTGDGEDHARQLGVSVESMRVRKHRIIAKLKKILRNLYRAAS